MDEYFDENGKLITNLENKLVIIKGKTYKTKTG